MKKTTTLIIIFLLSLSCFAQDTQAPTAPVNFQFFPDNPISALTPESFTIQWEHATDNVGVATYEIYVNGILDEIVAYDGSNSIQYQYFSNFPNGTHCLTMLARDAAGNASPLTSQICKNIYVIYQNEPNKLYISGVLNHLGDDKAIELSNLTYQDINLENHTIKISYDGSGTWDTVYTFPANTIVQSGETYVIAHPNISKCTSLVNEYDSTITNFDGNDVIGLFKYNVYYDTIGELGNPGTIINPDLFIKRTFMSDIPTTNFDGGQWDSDGNNGMCPGTFGFAGIAVLDTEEVEVNSFQIYPNPIKGNTLQFNTKNNQTINSISVIDINGRVVLSTSNMTNNQLDIQSIKQGVYFVKIKSGSKVSTHKLVRQ